MKHLIFLALALFTSTLFAQNTNDVTLTVVGSGKTIEEAKTNALRSAIEQAYGAFVSSNTEILNDEIVKDEIVSISSGNIKKYEVLSQSELLNDLVSVTLSATVSVSRLQSYAQSKGATVEFAGGAFAMNMKLQKLNEDAELKAVINLCRLTYQRFTTCFDFIIETKDPTFVEENKYLIEYRVTANTNDNFKPAFEYFISTLGSLKMPAKEISNYLEVKKPVYSILIPSKSGMNKYDFKLLGCFENSRNQLNYLRDDQSCFQTYEQLSFRNRNTINVLNNLIIKSNVFPIFFEINRLNEKISPFIIGKTENQEWTLFDGIKTSSLSYGYSAGGESEHSFPDSPDHRTYEHLKSSQQYGFPAVMLGFGSRNGSPDAVFGYGARGRSTLSFFFGHIKYLSSIVADYCYSSRVVADNKCRYFLGLEMDLSQFGDTPSNSFILSRATDYEFTAVCKEYLTLEQLENLSEITVEPIYK